MPDWVWPQPPCSTLDFSRSYDALGNLQRDGYQYSIVEGENVLSRLYVDYHEVTAAVFDTLEANALLDGEYFHTSGHLIGTDGTTLALDVDYDVSQMGYTAGALAISLHFADGDTSFARRAEVLLLVKESFEQAHVGFAIVNFGIYTD